MTSQEVFDQVVTHLRKQECKAEDNHSSLCMYRTQGGLKCAAGCLINDDEYAPWMERRLIGNVLTHPNTPKSLVDRLEEHGNLIMRLQNVHDDYQPTQWEPKFQKVAEDFGLKYELTEGK